MNYLTDEELLALPTGTEFAFDVESYKNFWEVGFKHIESGKAVVFEENPAQTFDREKLRWMLWNFKIIGFYSNGYDIPQTILAMEGMTAPELHTVTKRLIEGELKPWHVEQEFRINFPSLNHIDLIEVCPLQGSLKLYAARLHCRHMQDLPIDPNKELTYEEAEIIKEYNINDLDNTILVYNELAEQIKLREQMSEEYGIDLRSKSDAQIAEAVIGSEICKIKGFYPKRPKSETIPKVIYYNAPEFIRFRDLKLNAMLDQICRSGFTLDKDGSPLWPEGLGAKEKNTSGKYSWVLKVTIGNSTYKLGMGGLHSMEKSIAHYSDEDTILVDRDVESYYPRIIINQQLYPDHLGPAFLEVYTGIVNRRVEAKRSKNTVVADSLKITINGSFGKFGSKWSILYAPNLMLQVTLTGQLALLMLVEALHDHGIDVVSANTDGIVIKCPKNKYAVLNTIIEQWEQWTQFKTEETKYLATYSRDINNYIAVKTDGTCKTKGAYSNPWNDPKAKIFRFHKNPQTTICIEAVTEFLTKGIALEQTITDCTDIRKFVAVQNVRGGAVKDGKFLGKVVRWYYAKNEKGCIAYKSTGNKVANSDGGKPLMTLPDSLPTDIDYDWYVEKANKILYDIGRFKKPTTRKLF